MEALRSNFTGNVRNLNANYNRNAVKFGNGSNPQIKNDNLIPLDKFVSNANTLKQVEKTLTETLEAVGETPKGSILKLANAVKLIATTDGMTGLLNKRVHVSTMNKALLQSQKTGESLRLGMVDVDYFKSVNDVLGHDVGDKLISAVGKAINEGLNGNTKVKACRFGGEEFTLIMQGTTKDESMEIMKKVLNAVKDSPTFKETFPDYIKKIDRDLVKFESINKSISETLIGLKKESKTTSDTQKLSLKIEKILTEGVLDITQPERKKEISAYLEYFKQKPTDLGSFNADFKLKDTTIDLGYAIKLFNKQEEVASLTKWKKHVTDNNNMFTVSGGVSAEYTGKTSKEFSETRDLKELASSFVKQADEALYAVKRNGRNGMAEFKLN